MICIQLGDAIEQALTTVGITRARVEQWLHRPCRCEERKRRLNQLSQWAYRVLTGRPEQSEEYLERILQ